MKDIEGIFANENVKKQFQDPIFLDEFEKLSETPR